MLVSLRTLRFACYFFFFSNSELPHNLQVLMLFSIVLFLNFGGKRVKHIVHLVFNLLLIVQLIHSCSLFMMSFKLPKSDIELSFTKCHTMKNRVLVCQCIFVAFPDCFASWRFQYPIIVIRFDFLFLPLTSRIFK